METIEVRIHCIEAKARRLGRLDMIQKYRERSISWANDVCVLTKENHKYLNSLWGENMGQTVFKDTQGDLHVIRGNAKDVPDGYVRDEKYHKIFHPIVTDCLNMTTSMQPSKCKRCKKKVKIDWCSKFDKERNPGICKTCQEESKNND